MMKLSYKKGFTLIELLVVIAIIGILSSIVLASLNSARNKGADASVKGTMNGIRSQAELYYSNNNNAYGTTFQAASATCNTATTFLGDTNVKNAISQILIQGNGTMLCAIGAPSGATSAQSYAISSGLKGGGTWCIDSSGTATSSVASGGAATAGTQAVCL